MKKWLLLPLFLSLAGCAAMTPTTTTTSKFSEYGMPLGTHNLSWPERQNQLAKINSWDIQGGVAAHSDVKGWNASFSWQQNPANYQLQLFGPLGAGRVIVVGDQNQVTLSNAGKTYTAQNPDTLIYQQLGWQLPISNLYYWVRGLPAPSNYKFKRSFDMNNHIIHLQQQGWDILYLRYISVNGIDLPDRLLLSNKQWHVRVVVTHWQIGV